MTTRTPKKKAAAPKKKAAAAAPPPPPPPAEERGEVVYNIPLELIDPPQIIARHGMDDEKLHDLETSIRKVGLLQPIGLRRDGERYRIIWGHRRFLAFQNLGKLTIPARVINLPELATEAMKLMENIHRDDLNHVELALTLARIKDQFGVTNQELASLSGYSQQFVGQLLTMLAWPEPLLEALARGQISFTAARELSYIDDMTELNRYLAAAVTSGCTQRLAMQWRAEYQALKAYQDGLQDHPEPTTPQYQQQTVTCDCFLCGGPGDITKMKAVFVHPECAIQFAQIVHEPQPTQDTPPR